MPRVEKLFAEHWPRCIAALLLSCALLPLVHSEHTPREPAAHEWPTEWDGAPLRPLAMSALEQRFAAQFPGHIARFDHGRDVVVLREVQRPTRMLHPAADCYRGLGYRIDDARLERDAQDRLWRCFIAERGGRRVRVCERIVDAQGVSFTDASAWFWAASLGQSSGPWRAVTRVESP